MAVMAGIGQVSGSCLRRQDAAAGGGNRPGKEAGRAIAGGGRGRMPEQGDDARDSGIRPARCWPALGRDGQDGRPRGETLLSSSLTPTKHETPRTRGNR
jgi:hypothetical protein